MRRVLWSICLFSLVGWLSSLPAHAGEYHDIYLSNQRICKGCTLRVLTDGANAPTGQVELKNRQGDAAIYPAHEIVWVERHPKWRKLVDKSLHNIGPAGRTLGPEYFHPEDEPPRYPDIP